MDVRVIGCGGIGSWLVPPLARFLRYSSGDTACLTLIDGDRYEPKNADRQTCSGDDFFVNKAEALAERLRSEFGDRLGVQSEGVYLDEKNAEKMMPEGSIVFVGVDNHKTRKMIADRAEAMQDVVIVSGGNELTDGGILVHVKKGGKRLTANLHEYAPEIAEPEDKHPGEVSCEGMLDSDPQIIFTNLAVASLMLNAFYRVVQEHSLDTMYGEAYVDILEGAAASYQRNPR